MRLLIVDDNEDLRCLLRIHFEQSGSVAQVHEAASVGCGLRELATEQFDWLILDHNLPDGTGFAILESMNLSSTKVILYTSAGEDHHLKLEALCFGVDAVFSKSESVRDVVAYVLRNSKG